MRIPHFRGEIEAVKSLCNSSCERRIIIEMIVEPRKQSVTQVYWLRLRPAVPGG